jgi:CelD/BcsL family acetyltransferase involved in cellulose biosynthesis
VIQVEALSAHHEAAYEDFVGAQPCSLLYQSLLYRDLLLDYVGCEAHYLVALDAGEIQGVLPLMSTERDGRRVHNSLPYYGSNGGVLAATESAHDALLSAYAELATSADTAAATLVPNPFCDEPRQVPVHNMVERRISQRTPIAFESDHEAALMAAIDSSTRRNVRKARAAGVEVSSEAAAMPELVRIHRANIEALGGLAKDASFFGAVERLFEHGRDYRLWVARVDGVVVAALLLFYFNGTVEYFTPAVEHDHRSTQPLAAILIDAMTDASQRGYHRWNWGGTWETQEGVYRFKRKWGAVERPYEYRIQLNDRELLSWPAERLKEHFPHFFVVPFSSLETQGASI